MTQGWCERDTAHGGECGGGMNRVEEGQPEWAGRHGDRWQQRDKVSN